MYSLFLLLGEAFYFLSHQDGCQSIEIDPRMVWIIILEAAGMIGLGKLKEEGTVFRAICM